MGSSDMLGSRWNPRLLDGGALTVYHEKTRPITDEALDGGNDQIDLMRGILQEGIAVEMYKRKTGRKVRRERKQFFHPDYPGAMTSADGTIFQDQARAIEWQRSTGGLEIKNPRSFVMQDLIEYGTRDSIIMQLQHSIATRRLSWGSYGFFNLEHNAGPIISIDVPADPVVGNFMLEISADFWAKHVVPRVPPDPAKWAQLLEKAPEVQRPDDDEGDKHRVLDPEKDADFIEQMRLFMDSNELGKASEETKARAGAELARLMTLTYGGDRKYKAPGLGKLTRVFLDARESFDRSALFAHKPIDRDAFIRWSRLMGTDEESQRRFEELADTMALDLMRFVSRGEPSAHWRSWRAKR